MMQILRPPGSLLLDFSNGAAYVDEQFVPIAEAKILILDWGFLHSDATYDVAHVWIANPEKQKEGLHLIVSCVQRIPPESADPTVKNYHWLDMVMGLFEAYDRGGETAVVVDARGNLVEGPVFNVFAVNGSTITTPARGVLEGITRRTVIELATGYGYDVMQHSLSADKACTADELFITSTAGGVMPVTKIDGCRIGSGVPGPVTQRLQEGYWTAHEDPRYTFKIEQD